jgi:alpha-tubulin suppressor-like RCC1 family protein
MPRTPNLVPVLAVSAAVIATTVWGADRPAHLPPIHRAAATTGAVEAWGRFGGAGGRGRAKATSDGTGGGTGVGPVRAEPAPVDGVQGVVQQISTSNSDGYALTGAGAVYAWGAGRQGELGDGSTPELAKTAVRVQFPAGVKIASLPDPMPFDGGMAIDTSGHVWAWGNDMNQEFCMPQPAILDTPAEVPLTGVTLAVGAARHATYDANGQVVSCGLGQYGQLGDGTTGTSAQTASAVPVQGLPSGKVKVLTAGYGDAGALMADGTYYDWGLNDNGQLGDGSTTSSDTAVEVALPAAVQSVSLGGSLADNGQTMALLSNGALWEWGSGSDGQLGNGSTANSRAPVRLTEPSGVSFVAVSSGGETDYAIDQNGRLWSWGGDSDGDIGNGTTGGPVTHPVEDALTVSQVSATAHDIAIASASTGS